jgi:hypothetical protein
MKIKTTRKQVIKSHKAVIAVSYCALQNLLRHENAYAYNKGVFGWNYDAYSVGIYAIATGYRNMPGIRADYDLVREYDAKANGKNADECRALILEFTEKAKG